MSVWDEVIGQPDAVAELSRAAEADSESAAMTHAWLITGPPGSGRSVAAAAFAAALVCPDGGCGECSACAEVSQSAHPDVVRLRSTKLSHSKQVAKDLVQQAAVAPALSKWRVLIVEDADRLTDPAANALLKAIEEPAPGVVWLLCAPSGEDLLPTIRSRTRNVHLRVPRTEDVAAQLEYEGIPAELAKSSALAALGHLGRARALATDEDVRNRRHQVLAQTLALSSVSSAYQAAAELVSLAQAEATAELDKKRESRENAILTAYGQGADGVTAGKVKSHARGALSELNKELKSQQSRSLRDSVDRFIADLISVYRDILVVQTQAQVDLANTDLTSQIQRAAAEGMPSQTIRQLQVLQDAKLQLAGSVPPLLVCESMLTQLAFPDVAGKHQLTAALPIG